MAVERALGTDTAMSSTLTTIPILAPLRRTSGISSTVPSSGMLEACRRRGLNGAVRLSFEALCVQFLGRQMLRRAAQPESAGFLRSCRAGRAGCAMVYACDGIVRTPSQQSYQCISVLMCFLLPLHGRCVA